MRTMIGKVIVAAAVVLAVLAGGCGDDKCPTESPQVDAVADCSAVAATQVSYPLRLCPTCNQTFSSCDVQMSGDDIFLNPTVEACESAASCGPGCNVNPATCTFTVPSAAPGAQFTVTVFDPASSSTKTGTLTIVAGGPSCSI